MGMNFFRIFSFYIISFIFFEFSFLILTSFSSQKISSPKKHEVYSPSLSLIGVIISKDTSSSVAVLRNEKSGKTMILKIGKSIFDMKLIHVFKNRIILQKGEKTFQIFLGRNNLIRNDQKILKSTSEIIVTDQKVDLLISNKLNNYLIKKEFIRSEVEKRIEKEWPLIIKETRLIPNLINGKISGLKISNLPKKGILSETGIYKNDVIKEINGIVLNDMKTFLGLYNKFKDENQFEVSIERKGKIIRLLYILK